MEPANGLKLKFGFAAWNQSFESRQCFLRGDGFCRFGHVGSQFANTISGDKTRGVCPHWRRVFALFSRPCWSRWRKKIDDFCTLESLLRRHNGQAGAISAAAQRPAGENATAMPASEILGKKRCLRRCGETVHHGRLPVQKRAL